MRGTLTFILLLCLTKSFSQETILRTDFTVRDFTISDSTLIYIEKRDIKNFNLASMANDTLIDRDGFFIGGYGLRLFYDNQNDKIITVSNELIRNISSIRFYSTEDKTVNKFHVHYTTELMDFLAVPKDSLLFLSKKDKNIEYFKHGGNPLYKKIDSIKLDSYARRLAFHKNELYYITDLGAIYAYDVNTRKKRILHKEEDLLVNFVFDEQHENIFVTTFTGKLIKIDLSGKKTPKSIKIGDSIIEALDIIQNNHIVLGDWDGQLKIIDCESLKIIKAFKIKHRIVKIVAKENYFYTSSSDRIIRRWKI